MYSVFISRFVLCLASRPRAFWSGPGSTWIGSLKLFYRMRYSSVIPISPTLCCLNVYIGPASPFYSSNSPSSSESISLFHQPSFTNYRQSLTAINIKQHKMPHFEEKDNLEWMRDEVRRIGVLMAQEKAKAVELQDWTTVVRVIEYAINRAELWTEIDTDATGLSTSFCLPP